MDSRRVTALIALALATVGCQLVAGFTSTSAPAGDTSVPDAPPVDPPPGSHLWSRVLGHQGAVESLSLAVDASGGVYLAGSFRGRVDLGGAPLTSVGGSDIFVASLDTDGAHLWSRSCGGSGEDIAYDVAARGDTVAVIGDFHDTVDCGGGPLQSAGSSDVLVASFDRDGTFRWSRRFGDSAADGGRGVAVDAGGDVLVTGRFEQQIDLGGSAFTSAGSGDIFLARLGPGGAHSWSAAFGDSGSDQGVAVAVAAGGAVALTGQIASAVDLGGGPLPHTGGADAFVARFTEDGAHSWSHAFGSPYHDSGHGIALDESGAVFVTGVVQGDVDFGGGLRAAPGARDAFVASFGDEGAHRWSRIFGGASSYEMGHGLALAPGGSVAVIGGYADTTDFGGGPVPTAGDYDVFIAFFQRADGSFSGATTFGADGADEGKSVAIDPDGNLFAAGRFAGTVAVGDGKLSSQSTSDVFLVSWAPDGEHRWSRSFGGAGLDFALGVAVDASDRTYVTGVFQGQVDLGGAVLTATDQDVFVASFDDDGAHRWSRSSGGEDSELAVAIAASSAGDVVVTGSFNATASFGGPLLTSEDSTDVFLVGFDAAGAHLWSRAFGGPGADISTGVAVGLDGAVFVAGNFTETISFADSALTSAGLADLYVAGFDADGAHRWSKSFGGDEQESGAAVAVDAAGAVTVVGRFNGTINLGGDDLTSAGPGSETFLARFTSDGDHLWSRLTTVAGKAQSVGLAVTPEGGVVLAGSFNAPVDFGGGPLVPNGGADIFVASLTAKGVHRWSRAFGDAAGADALAVATTPAGEIFVTGRFDEEIDFGGEALTSAGAGDIFVVSFDAAGEHRWSRAFGARGHDQGWAIAAGERLVVVVGSFTDRIDCGGGPMWGVQAGFAAAFTP